MALIPRGPGPPFWALCIPLVLILVVVNNVAAEKSKNYYMQHLCKTHFLQQLYRKIDGAVLHSQNERNLDCVITFQTHSILQRFMLRFDLLQLDCNDHLFIYDGAHAVGSYKSDLSCRNTKQTVGNIYTRTNFVTLKYVTDGWGTESNGFKLVITAFKDKKHACEDFRCNSEFCIDTGLVCDEVNHCGDGSDEASSAICTPNDMTTVLGVSSMVFIVVIVSALMVMCAGVIGLAICVCRRGNGRPAAAQQQNANYPCSLSPDLCALGPVHQMYGSNSGNGKQAQQSGGLREPSGADYPMGQTYVMTPPQTITRGAGNWLHPAGDKLGYSVDWRRLFCLAK